jgi:hypothetical protein
VHEAKVLFSLDNKMKMNNKMETFFLHRYFCRLATVASMEREKKNLKDIET